MTKKDQNDNQKLQENKNWNIFFYPVWLVLWAQ